MNCSPSKQRRVTAPLNKVLIATIALENGCRVYAVDTHFTAMAPLLEFQLYQSSYGGSYNPE